MQDKRDFSPIREAVIYTTLLSLLAVFSCSEFLDYKNEERFIEHYAKDSAGWQEFLNIWKPYKKKLEEDMLEGSQDVLPYGCDVIFIRENAAPIKHVE